MVVYQFIPIMAGSLERLTAGHPGTLCILSNKGCMGAAHNCSQTSFRKVALFSTSEPILYVCYIRSESYWIGIAYTRC